MSLKDFVTTTFEYLNLSVADHVSFDEDLLRPTDIEKGFANPSKAKEILNWEAKIKTKELVKLMVECEINKKYI
jgi:GDPmannose 4,6-dehydratase